MKRAKKLRKLLFLVSVLTLCLSFASPASAAVKISNKGMLMVVGQMRVLKVSGTKRAVVWSSSNKQVAAVSARGVILGRRAGSANITATVAGKRYVCKVQVQAPKLNQTKLSVTAGKTAVLKLTGTTLKPTWITSNKNVAIVTRNGVVKGIKAGTCKIAASVGGKKYLCTVTVKAAATTAKKYSVSYKSYETDRGVVVVVKNNYPYAVEVKVDCLFCNSAGVSIKKASETLYALEAGRECALLEWNWDSNWSTHKINLKVSKASSNLVLNANKIRCTSHVGDGNVMVHVKNTGSKVEFTHISVVFYKDGRVIGESDSYADVNNSGEEDDLELMFPYDAEYNTIMPDSYTVYVDYSYGYRW